MSTAAAGPKLDLRLDRAAWQSVWILVASLAAFGLMQLVGPALTPLLTGGWLIVAGLVLTILPALVWLLLFRRLDRTAPEPHYHLFGTMALGALLAGAVGEPLRRGVFELHLWSEANWLWAIPIYTLSQGLLLALIVYLAMRFSIFLNAEFDERTASSMVPPPVSAWRCPTICTTCSRPAGCGSMSAPPESS